MTAAARLRIAVMAWALYALAVLVAEHALTPPHPRG